MTVEAAYIQNEDEKSDEDNEDGPAMTVEAASICPHPSDGKDRGDQPWQLVQKRRAAFPSGQVAAGEQLVTPFRKIIWNELDML